MFSSSAIPRNKMPFQDAIVFVVGGGNYIEYQNLNDYVKVAMFFIPWGLSHYCKEFIIMMVYMVMWRNLLPTKPDNCFSWWQMNWVYFMCKHSTQDVQLFVPTKQRSNNGLMFWLRTQVSRLGLEPTLCWSVNHQHAMVLPCSQLVPILMSQYQSPLLALHTKYLDCFLLAE